MEEESNISKKLTGTAFAGSRKMCVPLDLPAKGCSARLQREKSWQRLFLYVIQVVPEVWTDPKGKTTNISIKYSKNQCVNFLMTQDIRMPKGIPEKFLEFGLWEKAWERWDIRKRSQAGWKWNKSRPGVSAEWTEEDLWVGFFYSVRWRWPRFEGSGTAFNRAGIKDFMFVIMGNLIKKEI